MFVITVFYYDVNMNKNNCARRSYTYPCDIYAPFRIREDILLCCCPSVCQYVGQSTYSFRSFSPHRLHVLKLNLIYALILIISLSSSVWGTIDRVNRLIPLWLNKIPLICSFRVVRIKMKFGIQIYYDNI